MSSKRTSHKSLVDLIRICSKASVELNSSGLEVFRSDCFGVDDIGVYDFGLIACGSDCLRETATLSGIVAVWSCSKRVVGVCEINGKIGEEANKGRRGMTRG